MPRIGDVEVMAQLLDRARRAKSTASARTTLRVRCQNITTSEPSSALVGKLRGSVLLLGPLLARTRPRASWRLPGGDFPARRTIGDPPRGARRSGRDVLAVDPATRSRRRTDCKPASMYLDEAR